MTKTYKVGLGLHFYMNVEDEMSKELIEEHMDRELSLNKISFSDFDIESFILADYEE